MPETDVRNTAVVRLVEELFTTGRGERADRLVLMVDSAPARNLGGWSRAAVADRLRSTLVELVRGEAEGLVDSDAVADAADRLVVAAHPIVVRRG